MSATATALLVEPANDLFLSMATVWEIAIKIGLKKLTLTQSFVPFMTRAVVMTWRVDPATTGSLTSPSSDGTAQIARYP